MRRARGLRGALVYLGLGGGVRQQQQQKQWMLLLAWWAGVSGVEFPAAGAEFPAKEAVCAPSSTTASLPDNLEQPQTTMPTGKSALARTRAILPVARASCSRARRLRGPLCDDVGVRRSPSAHFLPRTPSRKLPAARFSLKRPACSEGVQRGATSVKGPERVGPARVPIGVVSAAECGRRRSGYA